MALPCSRTFQQFPISFAGKAKVLKVAHKHLRDLPTPVIHLRQFSPLFTLLWSHWPPWYSLIKPSMFLNKGPFTESSFCQVALTRHSFNLCSTRPAMISLFKTITSSHTALLLSITLFSFCSRIHFNIRISQ